MVGFQLRAKIRTKDDRRAVLLISVFDDHGLSTLKTGQITKIACPPGSILDLSVYTPQTLLSIAVDACLAIPTQATIYESPSFTILAIYHLHMLDQKQSRPVEPTRSTSSFQRTSIESTKFKHIWKYTGLTTYHLDFANAATPQKRSRKAEQLTKRSPKHLLYNELTALYATKTAAFRDFKRIGGQTEYLAYLHAQAKLRRNMKHLNWSVKRWNYFES